MTDEHPIIFALDLHMASDFRIRWYNDRFFVSKQYGLFGDEQRIIGTVHVVHEAFLAREVFIACPPEGLQQRCLTLMAAVGYLTGLQPHDDPWQRLLDRIITGVKTIISRVIDCATLLYTTMKTHAMKGPEA